MKSALERMLDTEMDVHLGRKTVAALPAESVEATSQAALSNRRNGHSKKTVLRAKRMSNNPDAMRRAHFLDLTRTRG
jgi:hypothetical protein